jgi:hypothetical protein
MVYLDLNFALLELHMLKALMNLRYDLWAESSYVYFENSYVDR